MSLTKFRERIEQNGAKLAKTVLDLKGPKVSPELQQERMSICQECPHLYKPTTTCKKCGCFMSIKTWLPRQECPIGKWKPDPSFLDNQNK